MKRLYIDFDGVILDTITRLYEEAERQEYDKSDLEFYRNFNYKCILKDKYIINDSITCVKKLIESSKFEVSILTHCVSIKEGSDKVKYIRKHFPDITVIICPKDISKTKMVHTKDAILVDDYEGNLKEWEKEGGIAVKFSTKLKSKGFTVIDKLDELLTLF
jgi:hypothetical protein